MYLPIIINAVYIKVLWLAILTIIFNELSIRNNGPYYELTRYLYDGTVLL